MSHVLHCARNGKQRLEFRIRNSRSDSQMVAYLRSWLAPQPVPSPSPLPTPEIRTVSPPLPDDDDDDGDATETERDLDVAPAFPSLDSAQRAQTSTIPKILSDAALMPPPPLPQLAVRTPGVARASGSLAVPPTTTKPPVRSSAKREKVALAPGHSPLDWAKLKSSGEDLRVGHTTALTSSTTHTAS